MQNGYKYLLKLGNNKESFISKGKYNLSLIMRYAHMYLRIGYCKSLSEAMTLVWQEAKDMMFVLSWKKDIKAFENTPIIGDFRYDKDSFGRKYELVN